MFNIMGYQGSRKSSSRHGNPRHLTRRPGFIVATPAATAAALGLRLAGGPTVTVTLRYPLDSSGAGGPSPDDQSLTTTPSQPIAVASSKQLRPNLSAATEFSNQQGNRYCASPKGQNFLSGQSVRTLCHPNIRAASVACPRTGLNLKPFPR
jgi:hypothetical protein